MVAVRRQLLLAAWCCTLQRLTGWSAAAFHRPASAKPRVFSMSSSAAAAGRSLDTPASLEVRSTIFAVSSGAGVRCGVVVIRISGADARLAFQRMTARGRRDPSLEWLVPRMATLVKLLAPSTEERLDSALALWFPAPRSFTGEDVTELHVHGGRAVVAAVLAALGTLPGHRLAERGEFTRRAFQNQRMDLTEVEGLSDLLAANTDSQRRQALAQMGGAARERFDGWRAEILGCLAHTEAVIDFGEDADDLGSDVLDAVRPRVRALAEEMHVALSNARRGELLRDGPRVVILGAPNAGKSSLLNLLAQRPAAIVTPIAGTTRDVLELELELGGFPLRLCDTAGLRDLAHADEIEAEGMRRARDLVPQAAMLMIVVDSSSQPLPSLAELVRLVAGEPAHALPGSAPLGGGGAAAGGTSEQPPLLQLGLAECEAAVRQAVVVLNKVDALSAGAAGTLVEGIPAAQQFALSCKTGQGTDSLLLALETRVRGLLEGDGTGETTLVTRARHREHLEQAVGALERFERMDGLLLDLAAEELRIAALEVGKVTGRIHVEEMLDIIFRDFCIGK